ncbi:MAG: hypothetical protein D6790_09810 [Caldilineae bacterium]|nr:MAG: hypothetical protein D6790_09810 [Caldilineae bacterium]
MFCPSAPAIWIERRGVFMPEGTEREPIPAHFNTLREAAEFWDVHSVADYLDQMEEVEAQVDLQRRIFLAPIEENLYLRIKTQAELRHTTVESLINQWLEDQLTVVERG